jgi:hypothetical protein
MNLFVRDGLFYFAGAVVTLPVWSSLSNGTPRFWTMPARMVLSVALFWPALLLGFCLGLVLRYPMAKALEIYAYYRSDNRR